MWLSGLHSVVAKMMLGVIPLEVLLSLPSLHHNTLKSSVTNNQYSITLTVVSSTRTLGLFSGLIKLSHSSVPYEHRQTAKVAV